MGTTPSKLDPNEPKKRSNQSGWWYCVSLAKLRTVTTAQLLLNKTVLGIVVRFGFICWKIQSIQKKEDKITITIATRISPYGYMA